MKREAIAYHEAGHAVAAFTRQIPFDSVTVEPDSETDSLGRIVLSAMSRDDELTFDETVSRAIVALAGPYAEQRFSSSVLDIEGADRDTVVNALIDREPDDKAREALAEYLHAKARRLVADRWTDVEKTARALLEQRTVTRVELFALLTGIQIVSGTEQ